jgi:hypothetical protein
VEKINAGSQGNWDRLARKKLIRNLFLELGFKLKLDQRKRRSVKIGTGDKK